MPVRSRMKIALVSPYDFPYPGGVTEHIVALAKGAQKRGHEVHIIAACSGYQNETFPKTHTITRKLTTIPVGGSMARVGLSPLSYDKIKKVLRREIYDVIHLHEPLTPSITWVVLMQAHLQPQAVTIGTFHAYHEQPNWLYAYSQPIFGRFFNKLDSLIAVSGAARNFAQRMFPGDYRLIPNGVDIHRFSKKNGAHHSSMSSDRTEKVTILFVGRLDKRKGFLNLLRAFVKIKPDYPHICLRVVGPFEADACRSYRDLIQAHGVTDIEFVGYVSPDSLPDVYHTADIFCAPSVGFESFGIVLLEAMAAELPIVATSIVGYRSVITAGNEGLLVPPGQPEQLASALCQLIDNPQQRQMMGRLGRLKAERYNWDHIVDRVLDVYEDTIARKKRTFPKSLYQMEPAVTIQRRQANPEGKSC
jgi:phosphatidylinositol alpha-mannosyltransferase